MAGLYAVSYTHLDVYKRQSQAVASSTDVDLYMWGMIADTDIVIGDEVALHVYGGTPEAPVESPLSSARAARSSLEGIMGKRGVTALFLRTCPLRLFPACCGPSDEALSLIHI